MPTETTLHFRAAYDLHLADMRALEVDDVKKVNLDIPTAGQTVLGVVSQLKPYRESLLALPGVSPAAVDQLESRTRAMVHAHTQWTFASAPTFPIAELVEAALPRRDKLIAAAQYLAAYGQVDAGKLGELGKSTSHRNLAMDLLGLAVLLRPVIAKFEGKTLVTTEQLDEAEGLGEQIMAALGERQQTSVTATEAAQMRDRAFTLFINAYDQVQRGISYVRWSTGDADTLTPSLYGGKGRRKAEKGPDSTAPVVGNGQGAIGNGGSNGKDVPVGGPVVGGADPGGPFTP